ncbi:MAG: hypothetical protein IH957_08840 [Chloroflexi bacterium]|nr:hypothetical protein [Chloroflexota bacterium]
MDVFEEIKARVISRKSVMLVASTVLFWLGATDGVVLTTEQEIISGATSVASLTWIGIVDAIKAWRGT